uniref:Clathrin_bdg domain-containing protein n=1 Tax=Rhabditophanes sp. KR3021 TaxID=114890 RepID=A0AC35TMQ1_9BILA
MHVSKFYNWQNLNNGSVTASYSVSRNNNNVYPNPPPNNFNFGSERPPLPTYNEAGSLPEKVKPVNFDAPSLPNITITQNNLQTVNAISGAIIQPEDIPPPAFESVVQLNFDAPPEQTNHNILPNNSAINHTNDTLNWLATNAENSHPQIIEEPEEPTFIPPQPLKPIIYWDHEMINNGIVDMQTQKQPDEDIYQSTYADFSTINTQASSSSHDPDVADWDAHTDIPTSPHVKTPPSSMKTNLTNNPTNFIFVSNDHINFDDEPTPPNSSFVGIPLDSGVKTQDLYTLTTEDDKTSNV